MSHQQGSPDGDGDRSALSRDGVPDLHDQPLPNHAQPLLWLPGLSLSTDSGTTVRNGEGQNRDTDRMHDATTSPYVSSDPELYHLHF
jgi:hypothetical protein